jgi:hypothetical protein
MGRRRLAFQRRVVKIEIAREKSRKALMLPYGVGYRACIPTNKER